MIEPPYLPNFRSTNFAHENLTQHIIVNFLKNIVNYINFDVYVLHIYFNKMVNNKVFKSVLFFFLLIILYF